MRCSCSSRSAAGGSAVASTNKPGGSLAETVGRGEGRRDRDGNGTPGWTDSRERQPRQGERRLQQLVEPLGVRSGGGESLAYLLVSSGTGTVAATKPQLCLPPVPARQRPHLIPPPKKFWIGGARSSRQPPFRTPSKKPCLLRHQEHPVSRLVLLSPPCLVYCQHGECEQKPSPAPAQPAAAPGRGGPVRGARR